MRLDGQTTCRSRQRTVEVPWLYVEAQNTKRCESGTLLPYKGKGIHSPSSTFRPGGTIAPVQRRVSVCPQLGRPLLCLHHGDRYKRQDTQGSDIHISFIIHTLKVELIVIDKYYMSAIYM